MTMGPDPGCRVPLGCALWAHGVEGRPVQVAAGTQGFKWRPGQGGRARRAPAAREPERHLESIGVREDAADDGSAMKLQHTAADGKPQDT